MYSQAMLLEAVVHNAYHPAENSSYYDHEIAKIAANCTESLQVQKKPLLFHSFHQHSIIFSLPPLKLSVLWHK